MQKSLLDFFAAQAVHGGLSFLMGAHDDETSTARSIVDRGKNHCVGHRAETRENINEIWPYRDIRTNDRGGKKHATLLREVEGQP